MTEALSHMETPLGSHLNVDESGEAFRKQKADVGKHVTCFVIIVSTIHWLKI